MDTIEELKGILESGFIHGADLEVIKKTIAHLQAIEDAVDDVLSSCYMLNGERIHERVEKLAGVIDPDSAGDEQ